MSRFAVSERVEVAFRDPPDTPRKPHLRTPWYVRGKSGEIERICGEFRNPEGLAYGEDGLPKQTLYRVRFSQSHLWPDYAGPVQDCVEVEIYEHWLEQAS
jgi:nitrile hydratase